ncbi:helix-turn-helix transcriptional regulator [Blastococcus litoris]|uniref:helix-turn-helix transcriptional regulator n=1 Tax=Blastococcus litoris TaxID=2171622 RepID=UPI000E3093B7|nr:helix-turn-helix transcriptional regulator [Blastococcus litoris]
MRDYGPAALEMTAIAGPSDPLPRRGEEALAVLRRVVPFDSARPALVAGCANRQIARTPLVSRRTVAAHVAPIPATPRAPTRTHAAARAERAGSYVPPRAEEGPPP